MLIIVTGTIKPSNNIPDLYLKDSTIREKQYKESLIKLLRVTNANKIVFCENSNARVDFQDLYKLAKYNKKQFEFIQLKGNEQKTIFQGKGYGEGEIIEYVLKNSDLIKDENFFYKLTGRLFIKNLDKIIKNTNKYNNYFNTDLKHVTNMVDTKFYGVKIEDYKKYFLKAYESVDDSNNLYLEHIFYNIIRQNKIPHKNIPVYPIVLGESGSTGSIYREKVYIKGVINNIRSKFNEYKVPF